MEENGSPRMDHNHAEAGLQPRDTCPACDLIYAQMKKDTAGVRAALATDWLVSQPGPATVKACKMAGTIYGVGFSSVSRLNRIRERRRDIFDRVRNGELTISEASRQAGFIEYDLDRDLPAGVYFGKGDKFWPAIAPMAAYLRGWEKRNFEFSHLPPKEAARRLKKVEQLMEQLERTKQDLSVRSDLTSLSLRR